MRERRVRQHEIALRRSDGGAVHVLVSATGVFTDRGQLAAIRGQLYDLTAHKQLEEQLVSRRRWKRSAGSPAAIAHDFNNLLTVIVGHAELLLEQLPRDDPMRRRRRRRSPQAADRAARPHAAAARVQPAGRCCSRRCCRLNAVVGDMHDMLRARSSARTSSCALSLVCRHRAASRPIRDRSSRC